MAGPLDLDGSDMAEQIDLEKLKAIMEVLPKDLVCFVDSSCLAVYPAPKRTCLSGIWDDPDCVFFRNGSFGTGKWVMDPKNIAKAHAIRAAHPLIAEVERLRGKNKTQGADLKRAAKHIGKLATSNTALHNLAQSMRMHLDGEAFEVMQANSKRIGKLEAMIPKCPECESLVAHRECTNPNCPG